MLSPRAYDPAIPPSAQSPGDSLPLSVAALCTLSAPGGVGAFSGCGCRFPGPRGPRDVAGRACGAQGESRESTPFEVHGSFPNPVTAEPQQSLPNPDSHFRTPTVTSEPQQCPVHRAVPGAGWSYHGGLHPPCWGLPPLPGGAEKHRDPGARPPARCQGPWWRWLGGPAPASLCLMGSGWNSSPRPGLSGSAPPLPPGWPSGSVLHGLPPACPLCRGFEGQQGERVCMRQEEGCGL